MRGTRKNKKQLLGDSSYRKPTDKSPEQNVVLYKSLFEYNPDAIYSFDLNGRFTSANNSASRFSGYSIQELLKRTFETLIVQEDLEKTRQHFLKARGGEPQNYETRLMRKDGKVILLNVTNLPIIIHDKVTGVYGIAQDITARKQAEKILRESEEKYRSLASTTDSIYLIDKDCRYLFMNERHLKRFGLPLDQLIGRKYGEFHSEESTRVLSQIVEMVLITNKSLQHEYRSERDGRYFLRTLSPIADREGTSTLAVKVVSKDITDSEMAVEQLKETEVRYRTLFDNANDAIFLLRDDKFIDCNAVTQRMFGCTREQIVGSHPYVFSPPFQPDGRASTEKALEKINKAIAGEPQFFEWKHCQYDGTPFDAEVSLNGVTVGDEVLIQALVRDITDRKRAEEAIRESEGKYRTLIESTLDFVFTADRKGMFTYINPRFEMVSGRTASELLGRPFTDVIAPEARNMATAQFKKGIRGDKGAPYEIEIIHKSGNRIPVEFNVTTLRDGYGQPIGRYGIGRDLTERKRIELALKESEDRLRSIVQGSPISTFVIGKDHRVVYWNRALEELSQIKAVDVISTGNHWKAFYSKERPCMADLLVDEIFDKIPEWYAGKYRKSDLLEEAYEASDFFPDLGTEGRWLRFTAAVIRDTTGKLIGALETLEDISEHKQAEKELIVSEEKYRLVVENAREAILIAQEGMLKFVNRGAIDIIGYSEKILTSKPFIEFIHPDDREMVYEFYIKRIKGEKIPSAYSFRVVAENGTVKWVEINAANISWNAKPATLNFLSDITERKLADEKLRESISLLTTTLESTADGILVVDKDGHVSSFNKKFLSMWRIPESIAAMGDDDKLLAFVLDQLKDPEGFMQKIRYLYSHPDAESSDVLEFTDGRTFERYSQPQKMMDGIIGRVWSFRDVTERKLTEDELRESRRRLSEIIEFLPDATLVIGRDGKVIAWNRAIEAMTGVRAEEMLGKGNYEYSIPFYGERRPIIIDLALHPDHEMEKQYTSIQRMGDILFGEAFTPNLPPGNVHLSATASMLRNSRGEIIAAIECIRDNTERKRLEERLHRAEKMEALGTLAGGVAHDLNNVLGGLVGYSELLLMDIPEGNPWRRHVTNVLQSSLRAAAIIQDLLTLARRGVEVSEVVNLNNIISDYFKTPEFEKLKAYHPYVTYKTDIAEDLLNINGSPVHLEKTIMNLMSNASEAISARGEVMIRTENHYLDKPIRGYDYMREGDYVILTVSDNGRGISSTDIKKIFEPFYTKKIMGRSGTGLGLAVVWGTVKDHDGFIDVQSEDGKGSTFKIYLPVTREELSRRQQKISPDQYIGKGESILVVDDVKEQREVATSMLTRLGYKVQAVSCGEEAVNYLKTQEVDLLVLDMIMDPGIDGLETYQKVLKINPKQKAVIVSGFSETDRVKKAQELGAGSYVKKPYILEKLGMAIRSELLKDTTKKPQD